MRLAALPLAVALLAAAPVAEARGRAHRCQETTAKPVIGRARCHTFGRWDVTPPVFSPALSGAVELGWHRLLFSRRTLDTSLTANQKTTTASISGAAIGLPRADIASGRASFDVFRVGPVRIGPVVEVGGAGVSGAAFPFQGKTYTVTGVLYGSAGFNVAAGVDTGPLFLRAELFGGIQGLSLATESGPAVPARRPIFRPQGVGSPTSPTPPSGPPLDGLTISETRFRLAPRASVELWTSDYVSLGLAGAADVLHRDDFMLGAFLRGYMDARGMADPRGP